MLLALFLALGLGCSSARAYRADSLATFVAKKQYRVEDPDFHLAVGRLDKDGVVRVLGEKSALLAASGVVVQMRLTAVSGSVGLNRESIRLRADEDLAPLSSEEILAIVSLSASPGAGLPTASQPRGGPHTGTGSTGSSGLTAIAQLGIAGLVVAARAIAQSGNEDYRDSARADVEEKTALPREVSAGQTADLLLVFLTKSGKLPVECSLSITPLVNRGERTTGSIVVVPLL